VRDVKSVPPRGRDCVKTQNPTHGSGWIVQIPRRMFESWREKAGLELSTHFRGWNSMRFRART
jgi:hypothetical protein